MIPLTLREVAAATGARLEAPDPDAFVHLVVTDSRRAVPGSLFVALQGERADGHAFVPDAIAAGAAAVVAENRAVAGTGPLLHVADPLAALAALASDVRGRLRATVVAITGSSGKTCTKDLTAAALASERTTVASKASFNNEIGVPLTILDADERTQALVVEVGARGVGHIASLMPSVRPDIAIVTNVGQAHVGMFGSIENTARAKGELVECLGAEGVAILNADDPRVRAMRDQTAAAVVTFGTATDADVRALDITLDDDGRASFTIAAGGDRAPVSLLLPGEHMVMNALASAAAALAAGVSLASAAEGMSRCEGSPMRMQIVDVGGRRILNDAYNANPDSMVAALKALVAMSRGRPTWAVLGQMAELGDRALEEHDRIGRLAVRLGIGRVVTVGEEALALHEAVRLEGMPPDEAVFARSIDDAIAVLRERLEPNAIMLVKASRAAGLERIVEALRA